MSELKKSLKLRSVVSTSAGITFASSCFLVAVQVAHYLNGDTAWIAILVGGALCLLAGACFSELNGIAPSAAGFRLYITRAFNEKLAISLSFLYMIVIMGVVGTESFVISNVLNKGFPAISPLAWIVIMLSIAVFMNVRGIKIAGDFQDIFTYALVASIVGISLLALYRSGFHLHTPLAPGSFGGVLNAVAIGVFLFVGFEWAAPLAEEVTDFKLVGRGMMIAIGLLSVVYALFTVALSSTVGIKGLIHSPIPHIIFAQKLFGTPGLYWMTFISLAATITTYNAGLISVSRFMYASAREGLIPKMFSKINIKHATPTAAIYAVFVIALATSIYVYFSKQYFIFVNIAAAIESIVYAFAGAAIIKLRLKEPNTDRPYKIWGGHTVPILTILVFAILGIGVLTQDLRAAIILPLGFAVCFVYVISVVPRLKEKYAAQAAAKRASRPSRRLQPEVSASINTVSVSEVTEPEPVKAEE